MKFSPLLSFVRRSYDPPMRLGALLTAAFLLVTTPAGVAAQTWTYAESAHFEVYTTGGDGRAREALTYFERVHAFFTQLLGMSSNAGARTRLIVFSGDREFAPYRPSQFAAAFYQPGPDRDYIVMRSLDEDSFPIVVHEYVHMLLRQSTGVYPLWLNEGFAEFLSTIEPEGNRMNMGKVPAGRLAYITDGLALMDLERLFAVRHGSPEYSGSRSHAGLFYSQSWALTHMLYTDDRYRKNTGAFVRMVVEDRVPSGDAMVKAYGRTLEHVGRDLYNYVRQSQYVYFVAPYKAPPSVREVPTRKLDVFEVDLVKAHLLSNMRDREADARALYERLAGERPDDVRLLEARAYFELRRGSAAEALPYLKRAVGAGSRSPFIYRDYAMLEPARAEELLATAVELDPDDPESLMQYARVLLNGGKALEAIITLGNVRAVPLERRFQLFQLLANAYARLNRIDEAKAAAAQAEQYAADGFESEQAARLITAIADYERARTQAAEPKAAGPAPGAGSAGTGTAGLSTFLKGEISGGRLTVDPVPVVVDQTGASAMRTAIGRLRAISCRFQTPVIEIATADRGLIRLAIDDPLAVTVLGRDAASIELQCGEHDVEIRAGYLPAADTATDTVGRLRVLDYRPHK